MTRRRWIADEFSATHAALTGDHAAHLTRTLRAQVGQQFEIACGDRVRLAVVKSIRDDRVEFVLGEDVPVQLASSVTLLLAVFKFDRMEWAIEKCTELNVAAIVPVIARRTEKHLAAAATNRVERWRRIAREAAQQSRRVAAPEIIDPLKLSDVLASITADLRIVLAETEREVHLAEVLQARQAEGSLALAIGPEGGWTSDELQEFARADWVAASLGQTILRAETAAIAAVAVAQATIATTISD